MSTDYMNQVVHVDELTYDIVTEYKAGPSRTDAESYNLLVRVTPQKVGHYAFWIYLSESVNNAHLVKTMHRRTQSAMNAQNRSPSTVDHRAQWEEVKHVSEILPNVG